MREYTRIGKVVAVTCNRCKKEMKVENGIIREGCFSVNTVFGYFSNKDGERHSFDLCEECYDAVTRDFQIPITKTEETELC